MLCFLSLVAYGYIWLEDKAYGYKACYYTCGQRNIVSYADSCVRMYAET